MQAQEGTAAGRDDFAAARDLSGLRHGARPPADITIFKAVREDQGVVLSDTDFIADHQVHFSQGGHREVEQ